MDDEYDRLSIHMPPRHGKTESVTVRLPIYIMMMDPKARILITGHNMKFAKSLARKTRNLALQYGLRLSKDATAADAWETLEGGYVHARGVGAPPTGIGYDFIIIDDPIKKREEADSETYRDKMWDWYTDDLYTRLEPNGKIVLILTRWHEDDVAARALDSEDFEVLTLPAISDDGEALWPSQWPLDRLIRRRNVIINKEDGERSWLAIYQQQPRPPEGVIFKSSWFSILNTRPNLKRWVRAWDLAASDKKTGDFTVGVLMGIGENDEPIVADVARFRKEWPDAVDEIERISWEDYNWTQADESYYAVIIEKVAMQSVAVQDLWKKRMFANGTIRLQEFVPRGQKTMRADGLAARAKAKGLWIVRSAWNSDFIEECINFPHGKHDDQVDAATMAFTNTWRLDGGTKTKQEYIVYNSNKYWNLRIDGEIDDDDERLITEDVYKANFA